MYRRSSILGTSKTDNGCQSEFRRPHSIMHVESIIIYYLYFDRFSSDISLRSFLPGKRHVSPHILRDLNERNVTNIFG